MPSVQCRPLAALQAIRATRSPTRRVFLTSALSRASLSVPLIALHPDFPSIASVTNVHPQMSPLSLAFASTLPLSLTPPTPTPRNSLRYTAPPTPSLVPTRRRAAIKATQSPPQKNEKPDSPQQASENNKEPSYWQGEWICVDCGFVYKPGRRVKFEDLPGSWKCPQCNAPKRRFAKKAGDYIAVGAGTSNVPIIVFSVVGLIATVAFGFWASANL